MLIVNAAVSTVGLRHSAIQIDPKVVGCINCWIGRLYQSRWPQHLNAKAKLSECAALDQTASHRFGSA